LQLDELIAREEIKDVIKRLARGTDRLDEELMAFPATTPTGSTISARHTRRQSRSISSAARAAAVHTSVGEPSK